MTDYSLHFPPVSSLPPLPPSSFSSLLTSTASSNSSSSNTNSGTNSGSTSHQAANQLGNANAPPISDNLTNPQSISALLVEEYTLNPTTILPSFLECNLVNATVDSGRRTLQQILVWVEERVDRWLREAGERLDREERDREEERVGEEGRLLTQHERDEMEMRKRTTTRLATRLASRLLSLRVHVLTRLHYLLHHHRPELILLLTYLLERISLQRSDALLAESVYGMKRCRARHDTEDGRNGREGGIKLSPLTDGDRVRCALAAAGVPYLRHRLAGGYGRWKERDDDGGMAEEGGEELRSSPTDLTDRPTGTDLQRHQPLKRRYRHLLRRFQSLTRSIFVQIYPYLLLSADGAALSHQFLYLAGISGYYTPSMRVLGVLCRRVTRADLAGGGRAGGVGGGRGGQQAEASAGTTAVASASGSATPPTSRNGGGANGFGGGSSAVSSSSAASSALVPSALTTALQSGKADKAVRILRSIVIVGATATVVTGWASHFRSELRRRRRRWIEGGDGNDGDGDEEEGERANGATTAANRNRHPSGRRNVWSPNKFALPPPHPPALLSASESAATRRGLPTDQSLCPLCHRPRLHPAASTSGYVFCYRCLVMHLRTEGERCPITGMHCPESRVIRLFEPSAHAGTASGLAAAAAASAAASTVGGNGGNDQQQQQAGQSSSVLNE